MSSGMSGRCPVCYIGYLSGWSRSYIFKGGPEVCSYAHCDEPAVAEGRGRKPICRHHAEHQGYKPVTPEECGFVWAVDAEQTC
jgi:hypothetical protein